MEWKDDSSYIELGNIVSGLTVTNDAAERIVKLGTNYAGIIIDTLKPRYNDPFNNEIPAIKNLILSPSVVNFIVKSPCNNKTPTIKNKIFGPFRFVILRFLCIWIQHKNTIQKQPIVQI
jgi:hypothetical protein